jgi:hypothetical protein
VLLPLRHKPAGARGAGGSRTHDGGFAIARMTVKPPQKRQFLKTRTTGAPNHLGSGDVPAMLPGGTRREQVGTVPATRRIVRPYRGGGAFAPALSEALRLRSLLWHGVGLHCGYVRSTPAGNGKRQGRLGGQFPLGHFAGARCPNGKHETAVRGGGNREDSGAANPVMTRRAQG